jgi:hypothetical protein
MSSKDGSVLVVYQRERDRRSAASWALRRAVVVPGGAEHLLPRSLEERVIDHHRDRRVRRQQIRQHHIGQRQPDRIGTPPGRGEEPVRATVVPQTFQPGAQQHPAHRSPPCLRDQPDHQASEGAVTRSGETGTKVRQQDGQGR